MNQPELLPNHEIVIYRDERDEHPTRFDPEHQTVWKTGGEIADLLDLDRSVISRHVTNYRADHGEEGIAKFATPTAGGVQMVEYYSLDVILFIGYRAQANERVIAFRKWVSEIVRGRIQAEAKRQISADIQRKAQGKTAYQLKGKPADWALMRVEQKDSHRILSDALHETHENHKPDFGAVFGAQYKALFDKSKRAIVMELNLTDKESDNLRDHLGKWALEALKLASSAAADKMRILNRDLTTDEQETIVIHFAKLFAPTLRAAAEAIGVNFLSGDLLDTDGNRIEKPKQVALIRG